MPGTLRCLCLAAFAALALATSAPGQTTSAPIPTLETGTHTVYVDVVVRDASGQLVHGLTQQDFLVSQDGRPQPLRFFREHTPPSLAAGAPPEPLPAGEFSNVPPPSQQPGAINILLFDLLNTPALDQTYARRQLLKFLAALPPGQQVALFVLTDKLHMLQGFTSSSDQLIHAASLIDTKDFHILRSDAQKTNDADFLANFAAAIGRDPSGIIDRLKGDQVREDAVGQDTRARITLAAFASLARATSGYLGRKNLLWLSETFPLSIGADLQLTQFVHTDLQMLHQTADQIAGAHIAVYPISLATLQTEGVGAESSGSASANLGSTLRDQFTARQQVRAQMDDIAHETGGKAFFGTNDIARALQESLLDGSSYYALAYDPPNQKWDGTFRKIRVDLARKGYSLTYRRGYYAVVDQPATQDAISRELVYAMQPGSPPSTSLRLHARLRPASATKPARVICLLQASDIAFHATPDGHHHAQLLTLLVGFDSPTQATVLGQSAGRLELDFDPAQYQQAIRQGIPLPLDIPFQPAPRYLTLGIIEGASRHIGTLNLPLPPAATAASTTTR